VDECPQCHSPKLPHHVCPTCGTYNGREVIKMEGQKKPG
jgi:large subunit ribosomal protein L32